MIKAPSIKALWILHCAPVFLARLISTHFFDTFFTAWIFTLHLVATYTPTLKDVSAFW